MHDVIISSGFLVDGTGSPGRVADIAIDGDRITAVGPCGSLGMARRVIPADGRLVTPGFVDTHTHYDGQASWDPWLTPSSWHGVTTVVGGNCGVGFAPVRPHQHEWLVQLMEGVEDIPGSALTEGITWEWETFPEDMDAAEKRGSGPNLAFLVPLAPARTYVLGLEGPDRAATADETKKVAGIIEDSLAAGAWGWSTTAIRSHVGFGGKPLSARAASREELATYADVLKRAKNGIIELALTKRFANLDDDEMELLAFLLDKSNRPVTWLSLHNLIEKPDAIPQILAKVDPLIRRRGLPHVYLGYYVAGCRSLAYKAHYRPHEILALDGRWRGPAG